MHSTHLLARAIALAAEQHAHQVDKAGQPYILHPLRLMMRMETPERMMAAVLHDVVEDGEGVTLDTLRAAGFPEAVVTAVDHLTKRPEEDAAGDDGYRAFVQRAARDPIALHVKLADIEDNLDVRRLSNLDDKALQRVRRYHEARLLLLGQLESRQVQAPPEGTELR